jgi:hypothetical protein
MAAATRTETTGVAVPAKIGGIAGLCFALGLIIQQVLQAGGPLPGQPPADEIAFYSTSAAAISVAVGLVAINIVLIVTFVATVAERLQRAGPSAALCGRVGLIGVAILAGNFLVVTALHATLVAQIDALRDQPALLAVLSSFHWSAFALSGPPLGLVMGAFSIAALRHPVVPRWLAWLGIAGAGALIIDGALVVAVVRGAPVIYLAFIGFAVWVLWLIVASVRLLRDADIP